MQDKKTYFVSDAHLGAPGYNESLEREKLLVQWLNSIKEDAECIYFVGDIFDFWFEHKRIVPKGFTRFLGKVAELSDAGVNVRFFTGNHDHWDFSYFEQELGVEVFYQKQFIEIDNKKFLIAHGDGLGPGDMGYKWMKKIITHPFSKWLFARMHPNFSHGLANLFSKKDRYYKEDYLKDYSNVHEERLVKYARMKAAANSDIDFMIFGHRHLPLNYSLHNGSTLIILGDWIHNYSYAVYQNGKLDLRFFTDLMKVEDCSFDEISS